MIALAPIFRKAYWTLAAAGALYALALLALTAPSLQRHALYAHKLHSGFWHNVNEPESFGFAKGQITPFNITTPDGETLYVWHVLPLTLYAKHEQSLTTQSPGLVDDITQTVGFDLLTTDPENRLIINFHGNAGHVGQGWRPDTYRSITTAYPKTHLITVDYRGFGLSSGTPTEAGLITDGIALVTWALDVAHIPPERIVILGQSLGTAVASAVALHFADPAAAKTITFAGVVLVAPFTTLPSLLNTYRIGGIFPVLSPLRAYPYLQRQFSDRIVDTWDTSARLCAYVKAVGRSGTGSVSEQRSFLQIVHAVDDADISYHQSEMLYTAVSAAAPRQGGFGRIAVGSQAVVNSPPSITGRGPRLEELDGMHGSKIRLEVLKFGGHNRIVSYAPVALAVRRAFAAQDA
ncbi:Alpha/Beta hydrolase protein [Cryomyces antarcticus]